MPTLNLTTFPAPFVVNPRLSGIVMAYHNPLYIADQVLPRVPVDTPQFLYSRIDQSAFLSTINAGPIGRKGAVPEIDYSATELPATVEDYGIDEVVPKRDQLAAAGTPIDPKAIAAQQLADYLAIQREVRVANLLTTTATYSSGNYTTLSGTSQWSDFTNSDPLTAILNAMDSMFQRPNKMVIGQLVATKLLTHPKILAAWHGNQGQFGKAPLSFLAELLGLDEVIIGQSWYNTANKGQTPTVNRIWGKSVVLFYQAPLTLDTKGLTFGITAQWGERIEGEYFTEKLGLRGSDVLRVGESVKELILAPDTGYLFQNAIA